MSITYDEPPYAAWDRLKSLFDEFAELPANERAARLAALRCEQPALAAQLESLLRADESGASRLERPAVDAITFTRAVEFAAGTAHRPDLEIGQRFADRYDIVRLLGSGGMGSVYEAFDRTLETRVAVKVIRSAITANAEAAAQLAARFKGELLLARQITHKNVLRIFDLGEADGTLYITMALVEGADLAKVIQDDGAIPRLRAVRLARDIAAGLAAAHDAGVAHRDLKPANIMIDAQDRALIMDFGIARSVATLESGADEPIVGTFEYMAPEQFSGKAADGRADVYAFGLILSEMLLGFSPAKHDAAGQDEPNADWRRAPRLLDPTIPKPLEAVIERCLRDDPRERFRTGAELCDALEELTPDGRRRYLPTWRDVRKRPAAAAALGVAMLGSAVALAVGVAWILRTPDTVDPLTLIPLTTFPRIENQPSLSPDGTQVAFSGDVDEDGNFDIFVQRVGSTEKPRRLTSDPQIDWFPVWSRDGRSLVFLRGDQGSDNARVLLTSPEGGAETTVVDHMCVPFSWSPDSRSFACHESGTSGAIVRGFADGRAPIVLTRPPDGMRDTWPQISPDGSRLVFLRAQRGGRPTLFEANLDGTGTVQGVARSLLPLPGEVMGLTWTAEGRDVLMSIATGGSQLSPIAGVDLGRARMYRWRVGDGSPAPRLIGGPDGALYPTVAGSRLVFTQFLYEADIWEERDGRVTPHSVSSSKDEFGIVHSPDGKRIAFHSSRSGWFQVWIANVDGSGLRPVPFDGPAGQPHWSPDGRVIVFQGYDVEGHADVYRVAADDATAAPRRLTDDVADDFAATVSNNGEWIYFTSNRTGQFEVFRMPFDGGAVEQLTHRGGEFAIESADSRFLIFQKPRSGSNECDLWILPLFGGAEQPLPIRAPAGAFTPAETGIYYIRWTAEGSELGLYDWSGQGNTVRNRLPGRAENFSISPADGAILFTRASREQSDLMMVDPYR